MSGGDYVWRLSCPDRPGIVAAVSTLLAESGCNIEQSQQYGDPDTRTFFLRVQLSAPDGLGLDDLCARVRPVAEGFSMSWELVDASVRPKVLILVSSVGHCLNDLLFRASVGGLPVDVVGVVSNHTTFQRLAENYGVPFHHVPVGPDAASKAGAERRQLELIDGAADLVVLARYMQILSPAFVECWHNRIINIHHSFLPAFAGASPYAQAYGRGVKLIGATAHYVTQELDAGPIIEQDVHRVDHRDTVDDLRRIGRQTERAVLARAVAWHVEDRILVHGNKTIIFS